ncbi:MAG TPA: hypothetical protein GX525_06875 [Bacilli bacterium]|nr:hypothetical protein [Bacilli bacterium]
MGRQKKGKGNVKNNHQAKKQSRERQDTEFASYAEVEVQKMNRNYK